MTSVVRPRSPRVPRRAAKALLWTATGRLPRRLRERRAAAILRESGLFDEVHYLADPALGEAAVDPILHYVRHGAVEGRRACPLFDPAYYLETYPDVADSGVEPLLHFVRTGAYELRDPHPWFHTAYYAEQVPMLSEIGLNPVTHYLRVGAASGRRPHPDFDPVAYLEDRPEVAAAGIDPLLHFLRWEQGRRSRGSEADESARPIVVRSSSGAERPRVAVVLHLYYADLWDEVLGYLSNFAEPFDLFVSLCPDTAGDVEERIRAAIPEARVRYLPNRGRDVAPFVELLSDGELSGYELVCKIHSKKSLHRADGDRWRGTLLHQLLGAPEILSEIRDAFDADPDVGILGPGDQLDRREESWGSNRERMVELAQAMGLEESDVALSFFAGSMFWFRPEAFDALAKLDLHVDDFEEEEGQLDGTLHHALERVFPLAVRASGYRMHPFHRPSHAARVGTAIGDRRVRLIAFYLPQFHPIPENDEWWGPGFTEWTNVVRGRPLYRGHVQPRLPKDLGFYDLRVPETREAQAALAQRYGIHGFCYYYYWFDGRRLLERPLQDVMRTGRPDFPFCVCWANENWTRRWDGLDSEVLVEQTYSLDAARRFIRELIPAFRDPRYIRLEGRPVLLVYRAKAIPNLEEMLALWRAEAAAAGIELHLGAVRFWDVQDVQSLGFDAAVDFPPHHIQVKELTSKVPDLVPGFEGLIYDYAEAARADLARKRDPARSRAHRALMLAWDNTARRGEAAHVAHGATPELYREWLTGILDQEMRDNPHPDSLVFINAWNEWGEGATLEPDQHFGHGYLEATADAVADVVDRWRDE